MEREEILYNLFSEQHQGYDLKCHERISKEQLQARRKTLVELPALMRRSAVIAMYTVTLPVQADKGANAKYSFSSDHSVCAHAFCYANCTSRRTLSRLRKDISNGGFDIRKKAGYNPSSTKRETVLFILRYLIDLASTQGLPSPSPPRSSTKHRDIFLHSSLKIDIWKKYKDLVPVDASDEPVGRTTFRKIWKEYLPHLKIRGLRTDICGECDDFVSRIYYARRNGIPYEDLLAN